MAKDKNNLDDLIGSSGAAPIIVQEGGGEKKLLYILLIALLILFLLAIGLIAYLGGKYFNQSSSNGVAAKTSVQNSANAVNKTSTETQTSVAISNTTKSKEVSELEQMVAKEQARKVLQPKLEKMQQAKSASKEEQTIQQAAKATTGKVLSQEDLAKIAALVAKELAKSKQNSQAASTKTDSQDDAALAAQLEQAQTDTLEEEKAVKANLKADVKADSNKKVDTFNKVVVDKKVASDDELTKLAQEIDAILQSEDVKEETKKVKYVKQLSQEATQRAKEMRFIVVKKGDTLSSIAHRAYGRASAYTKIYEANPDIVRNPHKIYVGMRLRVPVDEEYRKQQGN